MLAHDYDARGRDVLVQFPVGTLGDVLAWFPYAARFAGEHRCRLTCTMSALIIPLLRDAYPDIRFVPHEAVEPDRFYATYSLGLFFDDADAVPDLEPGHSRRRRSLTQVVESGSPPTSNSVTSRSVPLRGT